MELFTKGAFAALVLLALGASRCTYGALLIADETEKSLEEVRTGAEGGNAQDQYRLGWMYSTGHSVGQDYSKAAEWYGKSAQQGNAQGENGLGVLYSNGFGVPQSYDQAILWYHKAADQGDAKAEFNLGGLYYHGRGVQQDYQEAMRWYEKAANQGYPDAQRVVGTRWMPVGIKGEAVLLLLALASIAYAANARNSQRGGWDGVDLPLLTLAASSVLYSLVVVYVLPRLGTDQSLAVDHVCYLLRNVFYGLYAVKIAALVLSGARKAKLKTIAFIVLAVLFIGINVDLAFHHAALSIPRVLRFFYAANGIFMGLIVPAMVTWVWSRRSQSARSA
jgi:tetratricopeptide (TPR) repeat protein